MATWTSTLDRAGITDPALRHDYGEQRRLVARYARAEYTAVRLLLPAPLVPDVIAATAFMHLTDDRIDRGPVSERIAALAAWDQQVRAALDGGPADQPLLRTLRHTVARHPQLEGCVREFLAGAPSEVHCEGFATEADFQHYIDTYSLPGFMLIACLLAPSTPTADYVAGCRTFIEASQRLDFLDDIAEDLSDGRLGIPEDALARHGLTRSDLFDPNEPTGRGPAAGPATPGVDSAFRDLVHHQAPLVRGGLAASHPLTELVAPPHRPLIRALLTLQEHRLRAVENKGPALLRGATRPPIAAALRILAREYRAARGQREAVQHPGREGGADDGVATATRRG
ncbi:squalene/phytoene synthase family protein [Streptomyces sp. NPDC048506]|uniref:phytoene/squalene synthase family protein n=1 Tax=Streptomyces sp. NPDC048506 TaxID=3155028 RepID=UPI0034210B92